MSENFCKKSNGKRWKMINIIFININTRPIFQYMSISININISI